MGIYPRSKTVEFFPGEATAIGGYFNLRNHTVKFINFPKIIPEIHVQLKYAYPKIVTKIQNSNQAYEI